MIIIFEPQCYGFQHVPFNSAFIRVIQSVYKGKEVLFMGEEEHISLIKDHLGLYSDDEKLNFREIKEIQRNGPIISKFIKEFKLYKKAFETAKELNADKLYFSSVTKLGIIAIKMLTFIFEVDVFVVPHAVLEDFVSDKLLRIAFSRFKSRKLKYLVLGDSIKNNLLAVLPIMREYIISIDHPYIYIKHNEQEHNNEENIKLAFLGVGHKQKGIEAYLHIANKIMDDPNLSKRANFIVNGHVPDITIANSLLENNIKIIGNNNPISMAEYIKNGLNIDYAVFLHDKDSYSLRASGVFFDAVNFCKPIISTKNSFIEHYFKKYGDIGYLCETKEEMVDIIESILLNGSIEKYEQQVGNIISLRNDLSIESIAEKLKHSNLT